MQMLKVRKLDFNFTDDVPFQWHPENPRLAVTLNAASFFAVGFERYVVRVMRDAMPLIKDEAILQDARLFMAQEAQHGIAHKAHVDAMIRLYPGLQQAYDKVCALFDALYENKSLKFRLAYIANSEATFPPVVSFIIDNREVLFARGDKRMSSLFLWHAIEEMEHRSSAATVYDHLVSNRWYRFAMLPRVFRHLDDFDRLITKEFESVLVRDDVTAGLAAPPKPFAAVPRKQFLVLALRMVRSLMPWHSPDSDQPPAWFAEWMQADRDGVDMTTFYGR